MLRCPVCKAENSQGPQCRRCKADLALLFELEERRGRLLDAAAAALRRGRPEEAEALAAQAAELRRDGQTWSLLALARLLRRDFAGAWSLYCRLKRDAS